jgi:hypothetical protein
VRGVRLAEIGGVGMVEFVANEIADLRGELLAT